MNKNLQKCIDIIATASANELSKDQAKSLIDRLVNEVGRPDGGQLDNVEARLKEIGNQIIGQDKILSEVQRRNTLLTMFARQRMWAYTKNFPTRGEGLMSFMNGGNKIRAEGRFSVYYQGQAIKHKYIGSLLDQLERGNLKQDFKSGQLDKEIFKELWELGRDQGGQPGITGSKNAQAIAKIIHGINVEMIARENRAGGFVHQLEGYIMRQTHDPDEIRRAGGLGFNKGSNAASFKVWSEFILPLLDQEKTFKGAEDKMKFLQSAHEGIISGIHNRADVDQAEVNAVFKNTGSLARKVSAQRVLHFKDADSAYIYNQRFGTKEFNNSAVRAIQQRAANISLMENFGPNPERSFDTMMREFKAEAKQHPDDVRHLKSLEDWRLEASFRELTGQNDMSKNPGLSRMMNVVRSLGNLSKLGASTITALADKGFLQSEMGYQGMSALGTAAKQFTAFLDRPTGDKRSMLNLIGAATDGFTSNVVQRFSMHDNRAGLMTRLQQKFFDLNGMNAWNDIHRGAASELMAAHLADNAHLSSAELPKDLANVLKLYGIEGKKWDAIRNTATEVEGRKYLTPDGLLQIPDKTIADLLKTDDLKYTDNNAARMRDELDTRLRTYFADRVDLAIPTPGNEERIYAHWNSQAGTPLGEAVRLIMMFKAMPITVLNKVVKREIYGQGADSVMQWLRNDRKGNFRMIQLMAMTAVGGYLGGVIKDALKGRTPKDPTDIKTIQDAMLRGGGLGIYGDFLFNEYDRSYRSFLSNAAGPVVSQLDTMADIATKVKHGQNVAGETGKLIGGNVPFINLFYIRPVLDYLILWNIQEMSDPGSLRRQERKLMKNTGQGFFIRPSEHVNK